ncbi:MAG: hybrid sensor histidine kinase/response regulator [Gammaproteobacteria bacterium]|nr:MAG: hybrid sensor histidine kinase/response regulator [Gammaproteobacteria bacterium]
MTDSLKAANNSEQSLLGVMQTFVAIIEIDGTVSFANNTPLQLAGLQAEDVLGKKFWDCFWFNYKPEIQTLMQSYVYRALAGERINEELQAQIVDDLLWISFTIQPVIENGKVTKLVAEGHDISEQHHLREGIRASQQRLQGVLDGMQTMVAILDLDGRVTLVNNTPLIVAGIEQKDILGLRLWECPWFTGDPQTQQAVKTDISDALTGQSTLGDVQILTPEGRLWVEFSIHPVLDNSGNVVQMVAEGRDPSVRRQVQEEREQVLLTLQEREQNLAITLDSIGDAVITTDADGLITRMNPIAEQLTGWAFAEAEMQPLDVIFPIFNASTGQVQPSPIDKLMASGEIVHLSNHTTLRNRHGHEFQIADSAAPIRNTEGEILGAILVFSDVSEQYHLREQAKATQERLQSLFDGMQTMVGILDTQGTMTFVNDTPLRATGFKREEILGIKLWEAPWFSYKPASTAIIREVLEKAFKGQSTLSDVQINTLGGELWVDFSAHPVFDDSGLVLEVVAEARNITARKIAETELRNSERRLLRYRDQAPLATIEWNTEHRLVGWNAAAEKLFGYTFTEVEGRLFSDFIPPGIKVDLKQLWADLITHSGGETITSKILTKDGETIYTRWHNAPFYDDDGEISGTASVILDLTNERAAQSALHESEKLHRDTLDSMVEGILVTDVDGIISSVNLAAERITGYAPGELLGQHVTHLLGRQQQEQFQHNMQAYLDSGDLRHIGMGIEIDVVCKNGDSFPTVVAVAELSRESDGRQCFISSFRDLSAAKQQEEQLRRSQKMDALGKLTGGIAHDFNNMLGIVTGYADLLESALIEEDKLAQYAREIHRAGDRGAKLTRKLLAFSQQTSVSADTVDINLMINNQQHMLATSLTPRIKIDYELASNIWPIHLDSDDLEDAIINICINAMHAIEGNGQVIVHTENVQLRSVNARLKNLPSGDYVQLSIIDNGKGMDEATRQKIFDPFYTTKGEKGTGLGLSQVYGFVERSRGGIDVASVPGRGTQFRLYFPREHIKAERQKSEATAPAKTLGGNETILVVDDETKLLALCGEILSQQGYNVLPASNCSEALQLLEGNSVDLMFSDVVMPDMDGYELAMIVAEKYPTIKIQMTSGFTDDRQHGIGDNSLHQNLLVKPYRALALLGKIRDLLDC